MTSNLLSFLIKNYDFFILDQWGVMHDGRNKLPNIDDFIEVLKRNNKKIILLSNSSQNKESIIKDTLIPLNFKIDLFDDIISSGEILKLIKNNIIIDPIKNILDLKNCYILSNENDYKNIDYLELETKKADKALFVLALSIKANLDKIEITNISKKIINLQLPVICTNPDEYVIDGNTQKKTYQVGFIANQLIKNNITVRFIGKPYSLIYEYIKNKFMFNKSKVIVFGDSLQTDIKGANFNNFDSVFLKGGVHKDEKIDINFYNKYSLVENELPKFVINTIEDLF